MFLVTAKVIFFNILIVCVYTRAPYENSIPRQRHWVEKDKVVLGIELWPRVYVSELWRYMGQVITVGGI